MDGAIKDVLNGPHEYVNGHYVKKEAEPATEPVKDEDEDEDEKA